MYVVFAEELEDTADAKGHIIETLEQAFAQIVCCCGYAYHFGTAGNLGKFRSEGAYLRAPRGHSAPPFLVFSG
jgi:hypothetical protein